MARVCIIGAGSSGIAACQVLQARGIEFDCLEKGSGIGGNWRYGLVQPLGAIMPIAERQAEWVADVLEGKAALPQRARMERAIERMERAMRKRYVASTRHTIQVDFHSYMRLLARERKRSRGIKRRLPATSPRPQVAV